MYQHKGAGFIPQSPSIRTSSLQSLSGSKEDVWGTYRHTLQFSLAGISASRDDKSHNRHSSLISRQHFLRSSNRLLSPSSPLDMQSLLPPPAVSSHTRIPVLDNPSDHEEFTTEKYTPLLGTNPSSPQSTRRSLAFWLILYFCFNLGLTLYNKGVLIHFPFPYTLTALHAFCGTIGGLILLKNGTFVPAELTTAENLALVAFSVLYTINIAVSNISLHLVTVPFHQVVRAATPVFIIILSIFFFGTRSSNHKMISLVPVMAGDIWRLFVHDKRTPVDPTGNSTCCHENHLHFYPTVDPITDFSATTGEFCYPPRLQLHPLDLLTRMAPLAFIQCVFLAYFTGELSRVHTWSLYEMTPGNAGLLGLNGFIAFGLNIVSFTANRAAGPLSMTVAANVKQVLSIFCAVVLFKLTITPTNALGILLTIAGGVWYAAIDYQEKRGRWRK
ncbi:triose-phosphate transporter family-domain-containing protein [Suillus fuscotomentosus]|uniref:Triose-phosphate transporter family-domain-containing protein n=1 Tax=Suillus fuscotomentosus TaxID=1912939 RepID=A0AAD4ECA2_9AGAM|nr:triose-phosphate transporter family-domain-containing protein [Suillus fuscotomentosus]KAG1903608.1 triose-phosphate transporter family-domain-containing protein [Suillus fuscotomentosus]